MQKGVEVAILPAAVNPDWGREPRMDLPRRGGRCAS